MGRGLYSERCCAGPTVIKRLRIIMGTNSCKLKDLHKASKYWMHNFSRPQRWRKGKFIGTLSAEFRCKSACLDEGNGGSWPRMNLQECYVMNVEAARIGGCQKSWGKCSKHFLIIIGTDEGSNMGRWARPLSALTGVVKMDGEGQIPWPHLISASSL